MAITDIPTKTRSPKSASQHALQSEEYVVRAMPAILSSRDLLATFVIILFFITNVPNAVAGGAAGLTFWIVGGIVFLIPCAIVTAQLGVMYPHEGSLYNWTYKAFGGFMSFFVAFCFWLPSVLLILATADLAVSYVQGLNPNWLVQPWQQGLVLIALVAFSGMIAVQRHRTVQNMINITACLILLTVVLVGLAGVVWLLTGHPSATSFSNFSDWAITWDPKTGGNIGLFGVVTLGYLGVNIPLNMGGEVIEHRRSVPRHLLWGSLIVIVSYLVVTFAVLVVQGQNASYVLYSIVSTVNMSLGKTMGSIAAICILTTFITATVAYNYAYARMLFVGSVDRRLPRWAGLLNRNRVPGNAILFQTLTTIGVIILFFLVIPYVTSIGQPANTTLEVYFVGVASATLLWAFGTVFLFVNVIKLYSRDPKAFRAHLILPLPVIMMSAVVGIIAGILAIIDTVLNSWVPLISNSQWWYIVGGLTLASIFIGAVGSMFASSEAAWQELSR